MKFEGNTFIKANIELDGNEFYKCVFKDCLYIYRGIGSIVFDNCVFQGKMNLNLGDAAGNTVQFLQMLYSQEGFRPFVENVFRFIRSESQETVPPQNIR